MRHVLRSLLSIGLCAAGMIHVTATGTPTAEPATMFRGDASGSGLQRGSSAPWIASVRFTFPTGGAIRSSPVARGGIVYVGSSDGLLHALDAKTGAARWRSRFDGAVTSTPAVDDAAVYVTSRDGALHAIDARTGRERWHHRFGADLGHLDYWDYYLSSPVLADGRLFVGSGDGNVYAFDPARGAVRWRADVGARVRSTPAVKDGIVVFGTLSGQVRALRERDGTPIWSFASDGAARKFADADNDTTSIVASPTIVSFDGGALVAVGGRDGFLYALELQTGRLLWRVTHDGSSWMLSTATDGRSLYVGGGSATLVQALDPATGVERWRFKTRGAVFSSLAIAGETVLASDFSGTLYALERTTGRLLWEFPLGARSLSTPLVADGIVYAASDLGVLHALDVGKPPSANDVAPLAPRRIVYFEGPRSPKAFSWFQNGLDALLSAQLEASGYEAMDAAQLGAFMLQQQPTSAPAVVVFADNRFPGNLVDTANGMPPIRRFLDAGGKIALLGPNPLAYKTDPVTGELQDIDFAASHELFDVVFPPPEEAGGYYAVAPTAEGRAMGLRHPAVAGSSIDAQPRVTPLALDEFGRSSDWLRSYGGRPGTGLLQIELPRSDAPDLAELRAVIEYGITW